MILDIFLKSKKTSIKQALKKSGCPEIISANFQVSKWSFNFQGEVSPMTFTWEKNPRPCWQQHEITVCFDGIHHVHQMPTWDLWAKQVKLIRDLLFCICNLDNFFQGEFVCLMYLEVFRGWFKEKVMDSHLNSRHIGIDSNLKIPQSSRVIWFQSYPAVPSLPLSHLPTPAQKSWCAKDPLLLASTVAASLGACGGGISALPKILQMAFNKNGLKMHQLPEILKWTCNSSTTVALSALALCPLSAAERACETAMAWMARKACKSRLSCWCNASSGW